jgi:hypothetical protein
MFTDNLHYTLATITTPTGISIGTRLGVLLNEQGTKLTAIAYGTFIPLHYLWTLLQHDFKTKQITVIFPSQYGTKQLSLACHKQPTTSQCLIQDWDIFTSTAIILHRSHKYFITHHKATPILSTGTSAPVHSMTTSITVQTHEAALHQTHLRLHNIRTAGLYVTRLRDANTTNAIIDYMQQKYGWSHKLEDHIDWKPHGDALVRLPTRCQKTITQLIHQWLPVNASHSLQHIGSGRLCPYCQSDQEEQHHLLTCHHSEVA